LDPIFVTQRPFLFYASIAGVNFGTHFLLKYLLNFKQLTEFSSGGQKIYYRRALYGSEEDIGLTSATADTDTLGTGRERDKSNSSSSKKKKEKSKTFPIVFIHGIGTGFAHYITFISKFPYDVDIFLIEWPYVAMQMTTTAPSAEESVSSIVSVLNHYGHEKATFVAHSLGTTVLSWMLHDPVGALKVANSVLLDPINFLLCDPAVCSQFVYRDPNESIDLLMHFFLSR
jgi:pimeloyl-ACP methyl ester carboxylesterase